MRPEAKSPEPTPQNVINRIQTFLGDAIVGTPKFIVFNDFITRVNLLMERRMQLGGIQENSGLRLFGRRAARMKLEELQSDLRVNELELAFLNNNILRKTAEMKGYAQAFHTTIDLYNDLRQAYYAHLAKTPDIIERVDEQAYEQLCEIKATIFSK